jgi:hypothetical protein
MASYPEFHGASFSTSMVGNQSNLDPNDPSNNYYIPALIGFSDNVNILLQASSTSTHFKPITNITVANNTNSGSVQTLGSATTDYSEFTGAALHVALPIGYKHIGTLGLSVFLPIGKLIETNSGNPFLPEYVMFHSRDRGTSIFLNFAHATSESLAWSLGTIVGFQATAEVKTNLSINGASYGSWAQARSKVNPSLGLIASIVKISDKSKFYLTYQQEMKSNLHAEVYGEISDPLAVLFQSGINSMLSYDPHTLRFGTSYDFGNLEFFSSAEYQMWTGYKTPTISITKSGGVIVASSNYEKLVTRDTINPRIGMKFDFLERWSSGLGIGYRMTPLKGNFSGSGNSIDSNTYIFSSGLQYRIVIWSKDVVLGTSFEYQQLENKQVIKTANQENGASGTKIGAPGYQISGHIITSSLGIKFNF